MADQAVRRAARRVATAMRQAGVQAVEQHARRAVRAVVLNVSPLALDVHGEDLTLYDDDVDFSQDVERYAATEGLAVGDELALLEATEGQWVAVTVISDTTVTPVSAGGGTGTTSPATMAALGVVRLSHAPAVPAQPVVVEDADPRNSDARTPTTHASSHATGGSDAIAPAAIGAVASSDARLSDARTPTAHHATHEPGGTDAMAVDAAAATGSLRTLGTGGQQAAAGNDSRLSNARTPTAHASTHATAGSDPITPTAIGAVTTSDSRLSDTRTPTDATVTDAKISGTLSPSKITGVAVVRTDPRAMLAPWDDGIVATFDPRQGISAGPFGAASQGRGGRVRIPKAGTLHGLAIQVGSANGNVSVAVYDVGATTSGTRTQLYTTGAIACPAAGPLTIVGDPNLTVTRDQWLEFWLSVDNTTATFARVVPLTTQWPTGYPAPSGGLSVPNTIAVVNGSSHPLPATLPGSASAGGNLPFIAAYVS